MQNSYLQHRSKLTLAIFGVPFSKGNKMVGLWERPSSHCLLAIALLTIFGTF